MKNNIRDNKYHEGQEVFAKKTPQQKLVIRRYVDRIYYCTPADDPDQKEVVLYERELTLKAAAPDTV